MANGLLHIGNALAEGEYNPGLGTSLALFLPLSMLYYRHARNRLSVSHWEIAGGILFGLGAHALLPGLMSLHMPLSILVLFAFLPLAANASANFARSRTPSLQSSAPLGRPSGQGR